MKRSRDWKKNPLEVDETNLEWECFRQHKLVRLWGVRAADAKKKVVDTKSEMELVEAELILLATRKPQKFGLEKTTELLLKAAVKVHPKYQAAVKAHNEARHESDTLQVMMDALEHKKTTALGKGVELFLSGYFADPKVRGRAGIEMTKRIARRG